MIKMLLKEVREQKGMSITELSAKSGVSKSYISEIEKGDKVPGLEVINKLAKALRCCPRNLYIYE